MKAYICRIKREDNQLMSCIINLLDSYPAVPDKFNDVLDDIIDAQIRDKIYFEGFGYEILEIIPFI